MKRILDFFKGQNEKQWHKQWWPYAVIVMYLLVVFKTTTFEQGEGWELQKYDKQVIDVASETGELSGTIGLKRERSFLKVTYNLYIASSLEQNEVCYICKENHAFSRSCRGIDQYNYAGQIEGGEFSSKGLSGLLAPVFCEEFVKPDSPVAINVPWSRAVCASDQKSSTDKFYFTGRAVFESYEEIFWLDEFKIFDAQEFTIRDSCRDGDPGSSFQQTEIDKAIKLGDNVKSFKLIFEDNN